jgi:hypothetical protein
MNNPDARMPVELASLPPRQAPGNLRREATIAAAGTQ